jgi:hypothetical protein
MRFAAGALCIAGCALLPPAGAQPPVVTGVEGRVYRTPPSAFDWSRIVGSWNVRVCSSGPCDDDSSSTTLRTLFLSIQSDSFSLVNVDRDTQLMLRIGSYGGPPWNSCFTVVRRGGRSRTYAGMSGVGVFATEPNPGADTINLILGAALDAFFTVHATVGDGRFEGIGRSVSAPRYADAAPPDTVVGVRVGPPDPERCIAAAHAAVLDVRRAGPP